jgi:hypothetical protein
MINHHRVNEVPSGTPCRCEDNFLSPLAIPPKTSRYKQEQTKTKEEATFPLQTRLTKNFFK